MSYLYSPQVKVWFTDRIRSAQGAIIQLQQAYNSRKQMFNKDEIQFIDDSAKKDLQVLDNKIRAVTDEIARLGKCLCELRVTQSKLQNIVSAIKDHNEEQDEDE